MKRAESVVLAFYITETLQKPLHYRNVAACVTFLKIPLTGLFPAQRDLESTVGWFLTPVMVAGSISWAAVLKPDSVSILAGSEWNSQQQRFREAAALPHLLQRPTSCSALHTHTHTVAFYTYSRTNIQPHLKSRDKTHPSTTPWLQHKHTCSL